jgi:plasmid segregation protein ParM
MLIGIDLGYGQVKSVSDGKKHKFLSVVGVPSAIEFEDGISRPEGRMELFYSGRRYYLGEFALRNTVNARLTLKADKSDTESNILKFLASLALHGAQGDVAVVTGLPVYEYHGFREGLAKSLKRSFAFSYNGVNHSINVTECRVIPQAAGAYYDAVLDDSGNVSDPALASSRAAVVDVGYRTTDVVVMDRGKYDSNQSFTIWAGIGKVHQELQRLLMRAHNLSLKLADIDQIARQGYVAAFGGKIAVDTLLRQALEPVAQEILEGFIAGIGDYRLLTGGIWLTGGGAVLVAPYFEAEFGQAAKTLEGPEFSNARGYYKYGRLLEARGK